MRLTGKVALISGGAGGLGAAYARALVHEGAKVVIGDIDPAAGETLAEGLGPSAAFCPLDVTDGAQWETAVGVAVGRFGKLNILINNAGILNGGPIEDYAIDQWLRTIDVNLTGAFRGIQAAVGELKRAAPSSIINISSTAGLKGFAGATGYAASKFGLRGMTKCLALELASAGVRVNSVHPGNVDTAMIRGAYQSLDHVPMARLGTVEELAAMIVFLAADESSFATGAEFVVDGGETAGTPVRLFRREAPESDSAGRTQTDPV